MKFELLEVDRLLWPGKLGIVGAQGKPRQFGLPDWEATVAKSKQLVSLPSGHRKQRATFLFASKRDLGRVELVYSHGYIWPVDPPRSGRAIMEELIEHLNGIESGI